MPYALLNDNYSPFFHVITRLPQGTPLIVMLFCYLCENHNNMPTPSTATPTKVTIIVNDYREIQIDDCREYTFYVNGQEYKELPLDANVREPDVNKSKPYKDMVKTLSDHPEFFFENNLGISVIAQDVTLKSKNRFELSFPSGTGILNGGHTQRAILDSQTEPNISKAIIRVTVRVKDYSPQRIAQIASAQNSSTSVKEFSLAEKKGLFADLKARMDPNFEKHIVWWEGKSVPANKGMEPVDLIAIINVFNIDLYSSNYSSTSSQPTSSASGKASVFRKWESDDNIKSYKNIYPLVTDILKLYELIKLRFADGSGMSKLSIIGDTKGRGKELIFSTDTCLYEIPKQMLFPLLAAYRANVYFDKPNNRIGWFKSNEELFYTYNKELCAKMKTAFSAAKNDPNRIGKDPTIWENLYMTLNSHIDKSSVYKEYDI